MPYPHILEWSPLLVNEDIIQLVQRVQPLDNVPKDCMLPVQVVYFVRQRDKELAATATLALPFDGRGDCHRHSALCLVFQAWYKLRSEVARFLFSLL